MASAQYRFSHLGIAQGLSQNSVQCVFQDSEGYMWIGTQDGLNRYDAYSFRIFRHSNNDTNSISDNFVIGITEDDAHNLWIATRNGMNHFDRKTEKFDQLFPDGMDKKYFHNAIRHLYKAQNGNIYFDAHGSFYCVAINASTSAYKISKLPKGFPVAFNFSADARGNLFAADSAGFIEFEFVNGIYPGPKRIYTDTSFKSVTKLTQTYIDKSGRCWVINQGNVLIYDLLNNTIQHKYIPSTIVSCVGEDLKGNIWIGSVRGVIVLDRDGKLLGTAINKQGASTSLSSNNVLSIYCDKAGLIWIGTSEGGLNLYNPLQDVFMICRNEQDQEKSISDNVTWSIFQDDKKLFVGTSTGLDIFTLKESDFKKARTFEENVVSNIFLQKDIFGKPLSNITSVVEVEDNVYWAGTRNNGIIIFNSEGKIFSQVKDDSAFLGSNTIFHLMLSKDGTIWISTINGLYHFDFASKNMDAFKTDPNNSNTLSGNYVISTYEDHEGKIWISTTGGLSCYSPSTKKFRNYVSGYNDKKSLSYNIVTSCMEDSRGKLWVTTLGGGINLFDPSTNTFKSFSQEEGLSNNVVYGVGEDEKGDLWMSSNAGISSFQVKTETFTNYFPNDGIVSSEYSQNGFFKNKAGEIYFASPEGLMIFNPAAIYQSTFELPVILTSYSINYVPKNAYDVSIGKEVNVMWNEKTISFEFAALDFANAKKISYSYKLEGFDNEWVIANPGQRISTYTNLPYGDYIFKVRIKKNGGQWSHEYLNFAVHVIPPFWFSWWFITGEILIGLVLLILVIRFYSQRKLRKRLQQIEIQQKIQFERERISRDLHDNVGAHLTYIIQSLDNISYRTVKNPSEKSTEKIDELSDFARDTMQQLRETIWAINKEEISISALHEKIQDHLTRLKTAIPFIDFKIETNLNRDGILKPSQAIHIFRLIQEAINNAIKHSGSKLIVVKMNFQKPKLQVSISDSGKGFSKDADFNGHYGLENMKGRVKEMGGELTILTDNGMGTEIKFEVPV